MANRQQRLIANPEGGAVNDATTRHSISTSAKHEPGRQQTYYQEQDLI